MKHDGMFNIKEYYSKHYHDSRLSVKDEFRIEDNDVFVEKEILDEDDDITWENDWSYPVDEHYHYFYGY